MPCRRRPVQDLFDFCARIDLKRINKRTLEALIRSGALDRLGPYFFEEAKAYQANIDRNRAVLLAAMEEAVQAAEQTARSAESGHMDLFGGLFAEPEADVYANHRNARELSLKERLKARRTPSACTSPAIRSTNTRARSVASPASASSICARRVANRPSPG